MFGRASTTIVGIGTSMIISRLLTPYDFGVAAAAVFFVQIAQRLANFGFNTALMQLKDLRDDHSTSVFTLNVIFGVVGGAALALAAPSLAAFYDSPDAGRVIPIAGITFAIGCLGTVPAALLARQLRFKVLVAIESLYGWFVPITSVVMALAGWGYWSLIYALLFGAILDASLKFAVTRWWPTLTISLSAVRELWSFGAGLHLKRLLESVAQGIDNMVIGRTLGLATLGIYDKSFTTMNRGVMLAASAGQMVSISVLSRFQDDAARFRSAFKKLTLGVSIIAYPTFAALAAMAYPLFVLMFGEQWTSAVAPFQVLCAAGILKLLTIYISSAVQARGRVWGEVWRQAVYVALVVIGAAVGSRWGLSAAAAGVLIATVVMAVLMGDLLRRVTTVTWADLIVPQRSGIVCGIGMVVVISGARMLLAAVHPGAPGPAATLAVEAAAAGLFACVFLLTCPFKEGRQLVRETVFDLAPAVGRTLRLRPV